MMAFRDRIQLSGGIKATTYWPCIACCILFTILLLIASTLVIALIPIYLKSPNVAADPTVRYDTDSYGFTYALATNPNSGLSIDATSASRQVEQQMNLDSGTIDIRTVSQDVTSNRKRRSIRCDREFKSIGYSSNRPAITFKMKFLYPKSRPCRSKFCVTNYFDGCIRRLTTTIVLRIKLGNGEVLEMNLCTVETPSNTTTTTTTTSVTTISTTATTTITTTATTTSTTITTATITATTTTTSTTTATTTSTTETTTTTTATTTSTTETTTTTTATTTSTTVTTTTAAVAAPDCSTCMVNGNVCGSVCGLNYFCSIVTSAGNCVNSGVGIIVNACSNRPSYFCCCN